MSCPVSRPLATASGDKFSRRTAVTGSLSKRATWKPVDRRWDLDRPQRGSNTGLAIPVLKALDVQFRRRHEPGQFAIRPTQCIGSKVINNVPNGRG